MVQPLSNEQLTMYGKGEPTRRFCYAEDEVDGIYRLFMSGGSEPVNIGNPEEYTVRQLAELVRELTGTSSEIVERPLPEDDPKVRRPDITRARSTLGWEPKIPVREGLQRTIAFFRERLAVPAL